MRRMPLHGRGTDRARIASARARGKRRRPVSAQRRGRSPGSRSARSLRPLPAHRVRARRLRARCVLGSHGVLRLRRRPPRGERCASGGRAPGRSRSERRRRHEPPRDRRARRRGQSARSPFGGGRLGRPRLPQHARRERCGRAARRGGSPRELGMARDGVGKGDSGDRDRDRAAVPPSLAHPRRRGESRQIASPEPGRRDSRTRCRASGSPAPAREGSAVRGRTADAGAPTRARDQARQLRPTCCSSSPSRRECSRSSTSVPSTWT